MNGSVLGAFRARMRGLNREAGGDGRDVVAEDGEFEGSVVRVDNSVKHQVSMGCYNGEWKIYFIVINEAFSI